MSSITLIDVLSYVECVECESYRVLVDVEFLFLFLLRTVVMRFIYLLNSYNVNVD